MFQERNTLTARQTDRQTDSQTDGWNNSKSYVLILMDLFSKIILELTKNG